MRGAIVGDIVGSRFEFANHKSCDFELFTSDCRFTDDTIHSVALAEALLTGASYGELLRRYYQCYPDAGYGRRFHRWAESSSPAPYNSYGNGSAMRVSPVAWFYDDLEKVLTAAAASAEVTHNHPEGVRGAQAVALAIFLARQGDGKKRIAKEVERRFGYDLSVALARLRPAYDFDVTCQGSVPQAIRAFLEGESFEGTLRLAVSIGGDSDTICCMAGSIAEGFYGGVPSELWAHAEAFLDPALQLVVTDFIDCVGTVSH
ncbi:MAG: hypothetical protein C0621_01170 [Desulfuromonas sp.]|nr:MAG: hypothetical protein C0621_01170 [Desulfuromonas sp.]